jgi:hypothetical protein
MGHVTPNIKWVIYSNFLNNSDHYTYRVLFYH